MAKYCPVGTTVGSPASLGTVRLTMRTRDDSRHLHVEEKSQGKRLIQVVLELVILSPLELQSQGSDFCVSGSYIDRYIHSI
jgi:hypothetical protein